MSMLGFNTLTATLAGTVQIMYFNPAALVAASQGFGNGMGDGTSWSRERGSVPNPGGGHQGHGGDRSNNAYSGISVSIAKPGESYTTPWGKIIINAKGHPTMNGIVMTALNSSMVDDLSGGYVRVLNSLIHKTPTLKVNRGNKPTVQIAVENYLAGGSFAEKGPIDVTLINTAISKAKDIDSATTSSAYHAMRTTFDRLPLDQQPAARDQINRAWQRAHDAMNDKVTTYSDRGGKNGGTVRTTRPNQAKKRLAKAIHQVSSDIQSALNQHQKEAKARAEAEARARAEARAKAEAKAKAKAEARAKAKAEAEARAKAKAEAEAKAKAEAEAKAKAEAEARAKAKAEAEAREAIISKENRARDAFAQPGSLAVISATSTPSRQMAPVFSVTGTGSIALTDTTGDQLLGELRKTLNDLISLGASVLRRTPVGYAIATIFHIPKAGEGSDRVPGRTPENFLSLAVPAQVMGLSNTDELRKAAETSGMMKMPVRGKLAVTEEKVEIKVIRTAERQAVRVIEATYDKNTGLYVHAIPDTGISGLKLVTATISTSALPGQPPLIASLPPVQVSVNALSGSAQKTQSTPVPVTKTMRFHDVITVYPESSNMKPVYVMFEPEAQNIAKAGRQYHPEPLTEEIAEPEGLIRVKSVTPSKTGKGMKGRWQSTVNGSIYEWNSETGKLEIVQRPPQVSEQSLKEAREHYHPTPSTKSLTDYPGLLETRARTPDEDGKGNKFRWTDAKGETLYEWNPKTGRMETYKAGHWETEIDRSGKSVRAWLVESVIDPATGLYGITLPEDEQGTQGRTVLVSPVKAPGADGLGHLLHPEGRQIVILNTGNNAPIKTPIVRVYPNPVQPDIDAVIAVPPLETNYQPIYVMFNSPYGETNARGKYSGRDFHTDKAGGPILDLDWRTAKIDRKGVDKVKLHAGRFGESPENKVMIERLEKIIDGKITVTDIDKRFYTHEIRELERYRNLGIKDGETPQSIHERQSVWNNAHTATLEDYKINEKQQPLYTDDALQHANEQ